MQMDAGLYTPDTNVSRPCSACKAGDPLIIHDPGAGVVELVDASDSKSDGCKSVGVRFPSPAPTHVLQLFSPENLRQAVRNGGKIVFARALRLVFEDLVFINSNPSSMNTQQVEIGGECSVNTISANSLRHEGKTEYSSRDSSLINIF
jgi:hypothetical protein